MKLRFLLICLCHLGWTEEPSLTPEAHDASVPVDKEMELEENFHNCARGQLFNYEEQRAMGIAIEKLGLHLLQNLPVGQHQPNIVFSPLSLAFALAQLTLGSRNETEKLLLKSLHANKLPCYQHMLGGFISNLKNMSLEVATRMYLKPGFEVKFSYVKDSLARYQSHPIPMPSVEEVNHWVNNATNGHIPNLLESISHDVVLMLINAIYFKGEWQKRFDPQVTSKEMFYLDNKNSLSVDMMKSAQYPLRLLDDAYLEAQVASFPFNGNTSFLIVMPLQGKGNVSSVLPKLNISDLYKRLPREKTMQVHLPKLKLQYRQDLKEALTSMGLGTLFLAPDLSGISDHPLRVTDIHHASTIELNEDGVEASATTAVTAMRSVSLFAVNSPFLFALVDDVSLTPIFMGIVTNPGHNNSPMFNDDPNRNVTMSDQPRMESVEKIDWERRSYSETMSEGGINTLSCISPPGHKEQLQQGNGLETNHTILNKPGV